MNGFFADELPDFTAQLPGLPAPAGRQRQGIIRNPRVGGFIHVADGFAVPRQKNAFGFHASLPEYPDRPNYFFRAS